ncbi:hypothetical protein NDU88_008425 [Pleurodeles waltl]|uniref:Uncharacterized protein n=1 Tax=Pleurodeles waltl TaxID=8319 RepID=A0AAV7RVR5_PLEWA|nr:hypothetical protein NDU88_008425 [Pleurodeles waltl]
MGKVGRRRDMEQKGGPSVEALADPPDPRNGASGEGRGVPTLQDVLQAITASRVALEGKIDALATDLTVLRDDHRRLAEKADNLKSFFWRSRMPLSLCNSWRTGSGP